MNLQTVTQELLGLSAFTAELGKAPKYFCGFGLNSGHAEMTETNRDLDFGHPTLILRLPMGQFFFLQQLGQRARCTEHGKAQRSGSM